MTLLFRLNCCSTCSVGGTLTDCRAGVLKTDEETEVDLSVDELLE